MKRTSIALELFAGCGGFSTGALDAGCKVVAGFDIDARSVEAFSYNHNYRSTYGYKVDLGKATLDNKPAQPKAPAKVITAKAKMAKKKPKAETKSKAAKKTSKKKATVKMNARPRRAA